MRQYTKKQNSGGFTLVEMLVSIALFAIVVTMSVGTLLVLVDANARSQSIQIAVNNLSFAIDAMTREIRTGTEFHCDNNQPSTLPSLADDCASGGEAIAFTDTRSSDRIGFALNGSVIEKNINNGGWLPLTGSNIRVTELNFTVTGTSGGSNTAQPSVTIYIEAEVGDTSNGGLGTTFQIQTSVTQRKLDL